MKQRHSIKISGVSLRLILSLFINCLLLTSLCHHGLAQPYDDAAVLLRKYTTLIPLLSHNQFQRPLYMESSESPSNLKGDIYAVVDYPFSDINNTLNDPELGPANWCDVLMLHLNIKYCHAVSDRKAKSLSVEIGKKVDQPFSGPYRVEYNYHLDFVSPNYFRVNLNAERGPLGTRDYRISLEAVAIDGTHTFLHLTYSCSYGRAVRMAMKTYLALAGSSKAGFTIISRRSNGEAVYLSGVRGVMERNVMRYYLAIDAYLKSLSLPAEDRLEKRLSSWFSATEQYKLQLHEVEQQEYMRMKLDAYQRLHTGR